MHLGPTEMYVSLVIASYVFGETSLRRLVKYYEKKSKRREKRNVMATSPFETSSHGHVIKACRARAARQEKLLGILSPLRDLSTDPRSLRVGFLTLRSSARLIRVSRYHRGYSCTRYVPDHHIGMTITTQITSATQVTTMLQYRFYRLKATKFPIQRKFKN